MRCRLFLIGKRCISQAPLAFGSAAVTVQRNQKSPIKTLVVTLLRILAKIDLDLGKGVQQGKSSPLAAIAAVQINARRDKPLRVIPGCSILATCPGMPWITAILAILAI